MRCNAMQWDTHLKCCEIDVEISKSPTELLRILGTGVFCNTGSDPPRAHTSIRIRKGVWRRAGAEPTETRRFPWFSLYHMWLGESRDRITVTCT